MRTTWWGVALVAIAFSGCAKNAVLCSAATCPGCCDATGACQLPVDATCGINGALCQACLAGDTCDQGLCVPEVGTSTGAVSTSGSGSTGSTGGPTGGATFGSIATVSSSGSSSGGVTGSGSNGGSGSSGTTGSEDGGNVDAGPPLDAGFIIYPDGGGLCEFGRPQGGSCNPECNNGFHCEGGQCILNGNTGPLEITLRWGEPVDLDLHVVEPGGCEVYYGNRTCTSGSLDLDSNPACNIDNVDTENVIFVDGGPTPPSGVYTVRVDDYDQCTPPGQIVMPYSVIVRNNGVTTTYCGAFQPNTGEEGDSGSAGSGTTVVSFTYP